MSGSAVRRATNARTSPLQEESEQESGGKQIAVIVAVMRIERGINKARSVIIRGQTDWSIARQRRELKRKIFFWSRNTWQSGNRAGQRLAGAAFHLRLGLGLLAATLRRLFFPHAARSFRRYPHERCEGLRETDE